MISEVIKSGIPVPKTDPPPDTPRGFLRLMKACYSLAPGVRPVFKGKFGVRVYEWRSSQFFLHVGIEKRLGDIIRSEQVK